jgi:uncharacterized SAM-binding protein YcdF (DUF218 family)
LITGSDRIILVTDGYHLPRSWASFQWAGDFDIQLVRPGIFPDGSRLGLRALFRGYTREALAIWFNLGRLSIYEILRIWGVDQSILNRIIA